MKIQHRLLSEGEEIKTGDEVYIGWRCRWEIIELTQVGLKVIPFCSPIRRVMKKPKPTRRTGRTLKQEATREAGKLGITVRKRWNFHKILEEINKVRRW